MRRLLRRAALASLVTTLLVVSPAFAQTTAEVQIGQGANIVASFTSTDACLETSATVIAAESTLKQGPGAPTTTSDVTVILIVSDICTGTQTVEFGVLDASTFRISGVASATVAGQGLLENLETGETRTVVLELSAVGQGEVQHDLEHFNVEQPLGQVVFHGNVFARSATATLSLTTTSGDTVLSGAGTGNFVNATSGAVVIVRDP